MHCVILRSVLGVCVVAALVCSALRVAGGQEGAGVSLPAGVKAVWDMAKAQRLASGTREQICINGLWRWQPAGQASDAVPGEGWGYLRLPEPWPEGGRGGGSQTFFRNPAWAQDALRSVTTAWYQRTISVPAEWTGRSIRLHAEYVYSYARVYVDGQKVGEMRYPWGDVDLTAACRPGQTHVLSVFVVALPLEGVMVSYRDTGAAREVKGSVERKGLCGDVYLIGEPQGARITDVKVDTSVRNWQIALGVGLEGLAAGAQYALRAEVKDGAQVVKSLTGRPFTVAELTNGRMAMTDGWHPEKLWDTVTPQNQYEVSVSLVDAGGKLLDEALPARFGFREFWIDGRDFYLNGTRIFLSALPIDNAQMSPAMASYDGTRATIHRFKSFGINFVYTHNYGCEPGAHLSFEEELRAADDEGMLLSLSQPHFAHYDWKAADADAKNGYAQHAAFYVHVAGNHPSMVCYSTSHNATGYAEAMNPDLIDGVHGFNDTDPSSNAGRALRAEAIIRKLDPVRFVYHHSSGNLGSMHTMNFYANFTPMQEISDWFEHWGTVGVKPVFTCEYSVPFMWDWAMYRGWYKGKREFGSAVVPWEFCVAEWDAQFLGDRAYQITEAEKVNVRWEAAKFQAGKLWQRWDYPQSLNSLVFDDRYLVVAMYLTDNWRAFRTWGMSANSPWDYGNYWKPVAGARQGQGPRAARLEVDWDNLQRPGPRPPYVDEPAARAQVAFNPTDSVPTAAAQALYRNNMPLLAYIGGKAAEVTSKDHNYIPGEAVEKQLIVINNSRLSVTCDCAWSFALPQALAGSKQVVVPTGQQERVPLRFELPAALAPGSYQIEARVKFGSGETQKDSFAIDVLPAARPVETDGRIALFDPRGDTAKLLGAMQVQCQAVNADADLSGFDTLIIGKGALTLDGRAPDIARVRDGLKVIIFEQTGEVLEKRFGFRMAEYGLRWVFERVPDHPLLAGISADQLRNWRGAATVLPPRLTYQLTYHAPMVTWCDIPVTRVWRCGNRGNVASALIEKPPCGDFLPILDGGYALQYTSLMEYREGKGMVLFCQTDVTGRTESDPAADALAHNILRYVTAWKPAPRRTAVYVGEDAGRKQLEAMSLAPAPYKGGKLSPDQVLVVGPGGGKELAAGAAAVSDWLKSGGRVLAVGLDAAEADAFLPATMQVSTKKAEHIAAYFEPLGAASPLAGVSPAEVHNRDPRDLPLVSAGAQAIGDGVLATADEGRVVFCQLAPWQFDYSGEKLNVKRTFRKASFLVGRLLGNMGVGGATPLLAHVSSPVRQGEKRWLDGLYLDVPEEADDPYRFFCW